MGDIVTFDSPVIDLAEGPWPAPPWMTGPALPPCARPWDRLVGVHLYRRWVFAATTRGKWGPGRMTAAFGRGYDMPS